jgi:ABC-type bacteriocin/lantibiotic exporter with double-glycine peptidase domain
MYRLIQQRAAADCGVAALTTLLSSKDVTYDDVAGKAPRDGQRGLRTRELISTARRLGRVLVPTRTYDLDRDVGVLRVRSPRHHRDGHWVVLALGGLILDPCGGTVSRWQDYARAYKARFGTLAKAS